MAHQGLDLGNVLQQVETIRGQRATTALNQQTLGANALAQDIASQQNVLLQQFLQSGGTDQNAFNALSPDTQSTILSNQAAQQGFVSEQQDIDKTNAQVAVAGATNLIKSANPKKFAEIALPQLVDEMRKNPDIDVDNLTNEDWVNIGNEIIARQSPIATAGDDPLTAQSPLGKIRADIQAGFLTEAGAVEVPEFKNVIENPDGSSIGTNTLTGRREIIPRDISEDAPQNKAQFEAINKLIESAKKDKRVDNFITVSSNFDRVDSASSNAAGDLALVFSFMKMLDPGSVVREGEQALARNAAGVPSRIRTTYNNILEGASLSPSQRKQFKAEAGKVFLASRKTAEKAVAPIKAQARRLNLRSETIDEVVFGLPEEIADPLTLLPAGSVDNGDGTFTLPDGTIVERE